MGAGVDFSHQFVFHESQFREQYAVDIEDPLFVNGQTHYTKWCSVGQQVRLAGITLYTSLMDNI